MKSSHDQRFAQMLELFCIKMSHRFLEIVFQRKRVRERHLKTKEIRIDNKKIDNR